jgi:S-DNA-T family DNA segregation ATPase FtsK/SpoIIIE
MTTAMLSALPERLILRLNEVDDYDMFGLDRKRAAQATLPPGRGFSSQTHEVQVAVVGDDPGGEAQIAAVGAVALKLRAEYPDITAPRIQLLPLQVAAQDLPAHIGTAGVIGIDDAELAPAVVDLENGHFLVAGPPRSGKSTALGTLARSLHAADPAARFVLLAPRRTPLSALDIWDAQHRASDEEAIDELLDTIAGRTADDPPLVLVVDDMQELVDDPLDNTLDAIARRGRDVGVHVLCACDRNAAHRIYGGLVHRIRADRFGLLLQPSPDADGDLLGAVVDRRWGGGPAGRGALVLAGTATRVQVATWTPS